MAYTYIQIQQRIADELHRGGLTDQIKKAIISAVKAYERQRFWFNEETATAVTTAAQAYVSPPPDFVKEFYFQITVGTSKYTLRPIPYTEFLEKSANNSTGQPTDYTYYADSLYLYPIPSAEYTVTLNYIKRLTDLSGDGDTNGWTDFAEELIRQRAKADVLCNQMRDRVSLSEAAAFALKNEPYLSALEKAAHIRVLAENEERISDSGKVKARYL